MIKILFDTQKNDLEYQFTQGMWYEQLGITKVLFDTQTNSRTHDTQYHKPERGKQKFY